MIGAMYGNIDFDSSIILRFMVMRYFSSFLPLKLESDVFLILLDTYTIYLEFICSRIQKLDVSITEYSIPSF